MEKLEAIIFDMDGTLADTEEIHRQAFNQVFSEHGHDWHWSKSDYKRLLRISGGKERIYYHLRQNTIVPYKQKDLWEMATTLHQHKSEIYRYKLTNDHITLRPGVERMITEAKQENIKLGVATSSSYKNLEALLHQTLGNDSLSWFDTVVTCDVVTEKKPSPAAYQHALTELGLQARNCIAIEDTRNGNLAALSAGLKTVITTHDFTIDDDFEGAALIIDQLGEPNQSFSLLNGNAYGNKYVTIPLLRKIVSKQKTLTPNNNPENSFNISAK